MPSRPSHRPRASDLEAYWMPFTANRQFKAKPRMLARASGMYYWTPDGRQILDGVAGLWCVNAGHGRKEITEAVPSSSRRWITRRRSRWDIPPRSSSPTRWCKIAPPGWTTCSSRTPAPSRSIPRSRSRWPITASRARRTRMRLIGRERGYHGVGFGGISVGGMVANRKAWPASMIPGVDHLPHTHDLERNAFSRGLPAHGAELADELERLVTLHDASTIAAVIVEPIAGSTGVMLPPKGYLQAPARDLRQARHAADIRRSDHRLRPHRLAVRRAGIRRDCPT